MSRLDLSDDFEPTDTLRVSLCGVPFAAQLPSFWQCAPTLPKVCRQGKTLFTKPILSASAASIKSAVKNISNALEIPISLGR